MKKNLWILVAVTLSTHLLAQEATNTPPAEAPPAEAPQSAGAVDPAALPPATPAVEPAPATDEAPALKPAKASKKKKAAKPAVKRNVEEKTVSLSPGAAVVVGNNVNVRAQARLNSEVVTRFTNSVVVNVIEQVNLAKARADEPKQWAKISYPAGGKVWVFSAYIDVSSNNVVVPKKLNLRAGPGENYSIVGRIEAGTPVTQVEVKGKWMQIEPPASAYAFVAAQYLSQDPALLPPPVTPVEPAPAEPAPAAEPTPVAPPVVAPPVAEPAPAPAEPIVVPRVVSHEGRVDRTLSIQAPTSYQLTSVETGKIINYLYTSTTNLDLGKYKGLHIVVTGEESIDERWVSTPVITIKRIQVLD